MFRWSPRGGAWELTLFLPRGTLGLLCYALLADAATSLMDVSESNQSMPCSCFMMVKLLDS